MQEESSSTADVAWGIDPAHELLAIGDGDVWTVDDSFEGTQIFGATGSGKTTGSGAKLAEKLLRAGYGGLVLTVKGDELANWQRYITKAGRSIKDDLIVFSPQAQRNTFPILAWERNQTPQQESAGSDESADFVENLVGLFWTLFEVLESGGGMQSRDPFWNRALRQLIRNAIAAIMLTGEKLTIEKVARVVVTAPQASQDIRSQSWKDNSYCFDCLKKAEARVPPKSRQSADFEHTAGYWLLEYPALAPETRSSIQIMFTSMTDVILREPLRSMFAASSGVEEGFDSERVCIPELSHHGKVIVVNMPIKTYREIGQLSQVLFKYLWQRAAEKRNKMDVKQRPMFLWADEAQYFLTANDMSFQTTAREFGVATVYLTQNISNYYALFPGDRAKAQADSLLGNLQTKIFHANNDAVTNVWAAELIAKQWSLRRNRSTSLGSDQRGAGQSGFVTTQDERLEYQVLPVEFTTLRKGSERNKGVVDAVFVQGGRRWSDGRNFVSVEFPQAERTKLERQA